MAIDDERPAVVGDVDRQGRWDEAAEVDERCCNSRGGRETMKGPPLHHCKRYPGGGAVLNRGPLWKTQDLEETSRSDHPIL